MKEVYMKRADSVYIAVTRIFVFSIITVTVL